MRTKRTLKFYQDIAASRGGKCLATELTKSRDYVLWECSKGHQWKATFHNIGSGKTWCPHCSSNKKKDLKYYQDLAKSRGGKCLSTNYENSHMYGLWECAEGHQWKAKYYMISGSRKRWCPECGGSQKKTLTFYQDLAISRGGRCLSTSYKNSHARGKWECSKGHQWEAMFYCVNSGKQWCPECSDNLPKSIEYCQQLAKEKGGKCLSTEYTNANEKYLWQCSKGHIWRTVYSSIKQGTWCPKCNEKKNRTIKYCQDLAKNHNGKCLSAEYVNANTNYRWQCELGHQWNMRYGLIQKGKWCPECCKINRYKEELKIYVKIAKSRGGKCLSSKYTGSYDYGKWECSEGHVWESKFYLVKSCGRWCPECGGSKRKTIEDCLSLAKSHGGKFLSNRYINSKEKYLWQCSEGHQWQTDFMSVQAGHWCPKCAVATRKQTNIDRYGVSVPCQNKEIAMKAAKATTFSTILLHWKTNEDLVCTASYEKAVVEYFNANHIDFHWQPKVFAMPNGYTYRPDCYLPKEDLWIEIKGYFRGDAESKWLWFHKEYPNSELWNKQKLKELQII